jgi:hypothetical protein
MLFKLNKFIEMAFFSIIQILMILINQKTFELHFIHFFEPFSDRLVKPELLTGVSKTKVDDPKEHRD